MAIGICVGGGQPRRAADPVELQPDGVTVMPTGTCITVTSAFAEARATRAVIIVVPLLRAVTSPEPSTPATERAPLDQITDAPLIGCPAGSRTSAVSRTVSSSAASVTSAGLTETVRGGAVGGGGRTGSGGVAESPQEISRSSTPAQLIGLALAVFTPDPAIVGAGLVREGGRSRAVEALTIVRS